MRHLGPGRLAVRERLKSKSGSSLEIGEDEQGVDKEACRAHQQLLPRKHGKLQRLEGQDQEQVGQALKCHRVKDADEGQLHRVGADQRVEALDHEHCPAWGLRPRSLAAALGRCSAAAKTVRRRVPAMSAQHTLRERAVLETLGKERIARLQGQMGS